VLQSLKQLNFGVTAMHVDAAPRPHDEGNPVDWVFALEGDPVYS
jgi:hypothetical protein